MANPFFAMLYDGEPEIVPVKPKVQPKPKPKVDHTEAKAIYAAYLVKKAELVKHQEYAEQVAKATAGPSMTPVKPLATMGCNGGALLCDLCKRPIILEGGAYNKVPVDEAWKLNTHREDNWKSWIKGGMVVQIVDNGTLRIFHGYDGMPGCYTTAKATQQAAEANFVRDTTKCKIIVAFLEEEFPGRVNELLSDIMNVMFSYDPGFGVNRP